MLARFLKIPVRHFLNQGNTFLSRPYLFNFFDPLDQGYSFELLAILKILPFAHFLPKIAIQINLFAPIF